MSALDKALYTSSTLALNPDTGKLAWYFQHAPGEALDLDEVFERVLVDVDGRKFVFTIGKPGILWKLDRQTGQFVSYKETIFQNVFDRSTEDCAVTTEVTSGIQGRRLGERVSEHGRCPQLAGHDYPRERPPRDSNQSELL